MGNHFIFSMQQTHLLRGYAHLECPLVFTTVQYGIR